MNFSIVKQEEGFGFMLQAAGVGTLFITLEDAKRAAAALAQALEWAAKEVPRPPLGPKEWSPRGRRGIIPEAW
jgi:hypothetical protein